ncbi:MAG: pyridoxamine 5'-phosphate oxidase family protein [Pseudomonadota bacterium]
MNPRKLSPDEIQHFVDSRPGWIMFSTISPSGHPHTVPLGYFRHGDDLVMGVRDDTVKIRNIERNSMASALLESGHTMADIKGVLFQGRAHVHRSPDDVLQFMRAGASARGVAEADLPDSPRPGAAFIRLVPERVISWDYSQS